MKSRIYIPPPISRSLFFLLIFATTGLVNAQTTELSLQFSSGLFSYSGASVEKSYFIYSDTGYPSSTKTPFGAKNGISYGVSGQVQRNTSFRLLYGIQSGYEFLRSKVDLYPTGGLTISDKVVGKTQLTNHAINFFPFIGKRFEVKSDICLDIVLGTDLNWNFKMFEFTRFKADQNRQFEYRVYYDFENPADQIERHRTPLDIRPRIGITGYYKYLGLTIGYSHGITNYKNSMEDLRGEIYSRYIRFGIVLKIL